MIGSPAYSCTASPLMTSPLYRLAISTASCLRWSAYRSDFGRDSWLYLRLAGACRSDDSNQWKARWCSGHRCERSGPVAGLQHGTFRKGCLALSGGVRDEVRYVLQSLRLSSVIQLTISGDCQLHISAAVGRRLDIGPRSSISLAGRDHDGNLHVNDRRRRPI